MPTREHGFGLDRLLIEPVWNRNVVSLGASAMDCELLIEPVWNRNILHGTVVQSVQLLIEPVWNRN